MAISCRSISDNSLRVLRNAKQYKHSICRGLGVKPIYVKVSLIFSHYLKNLFIVRQFVFIGHVRVNEPLPPRLKDCSGFRFNHGQILSIVCFLCFLPYDSCSHLVDIYYQYVLSFPPLVPIASMDSPIFNFPRKSIYSYSMCIVLAIVRASHIKRQHDMCTGTLTDCLAPLSCVYSQ